MAAIVLIMGIILIWSAGKPGREASSFSPPDTAIANRQPVKVLSDSGPIPEFRNPSSVDTSVAKPAAPAHKKGDITRHALPVSMPEMTARDTMRAPLPDSVDVTVVTEPWAHIFFKGKQIGTTPLSAPLRLPRGEHDMVLRNPAFPPIDLPVSAQKPGEIVVRLTDHVARIGARVEPWGEVYIDGEDMGATPFTHPVYVSPGKHAIRITHPNLGSIQKDIDAAAGQVLDLEVNMKTGTFLVAMDMEKRP